MPKVSIIVPVYNTEKYLKKCLDSLVKQTLKDIEILVINDGSKDNSKDIINSYAKKYKNIRAFDKTNGGLSDARNYGIKKATGNYIAFIDSDDYVTTDMYEKMYKKAISKDFDMVVCDLNLVYENSEKKDRISSNVKNDTNNVKEVMRTIYPVAWNKIFKKELFDLGIEFKKGIWFEDVEFLYRILPYIKSIGVVKEPFNQYLQREGSISKSTDNKLYNYIDNWNGIVKFYKEKKLYNKFYKELEYSYVRYLYATFIKQASNFEKKEFNNAVDEAIKNVKKEFPKYRRNKYFYVSLKGIYLLMFNRFLAKMMYKHYKK